jgi:hypothetical protein
MFAPMVAEMRGLDLSGQHELAQWLLERFRIEQKGCRELNRDFAEVARKQRETGLRR